MEKKRSHYLRNEGSCFFLMPGIGVALLVIATNNPGWKIIAEWQRANTIAFWYEAGGMGE